MTRQIFAVEGSGHFPWDMLRYDYCYPYDQEDVDKLQDSMEHRVIWLARTVRNKNIPPSVDRWVSFGWTPQLNTIKLYKI